MWTTRRAGLVAAQRCVLAFSVREVIRMKTIVIMGAGGRDFHDFNVVYRDDPATRVVAFTASQIPGIDDRCYPPVLAGSLYPDGIPIVPEGALEEVIEAHPSTRSCSPTPTSRTWT